MFAGTAAERQIRIRSAYRLWKENPAHPSLRFKRFIRDCPFTQHVLFLIGEQLGY